MLPKLSCVTKVHTHTHIHTHYYCPPRERHNAAVHIFTQTQIETFPLRHAWKYNMVYIYIKGAHLPALSAPVHGPYTWWDYSHGCFPQVYTVKTWVPSHHHPVHPQLEWWWLCGAHWGRGLDPRQRERFLVDTVLPYLHFYIFKSWLKSDHNKVLLDIFRVSSKPLGTHYTFKHWCQLHMSSSLLFISHRAIKQISNAFITGSAQHRLCCRLTRNWCVCSISTSFKMAGKVRDYTDFKQVPWLIIFPN